MYLLKRDRRYRRYLDLYLTMQSVPSTTYVVCLIQCHFVMCSIHLDMIKCVTDFRQIGVFPLYTDVLNKQCLLLFIQWLMVFLQSLDIQFFKVIY